MTDTAKAAQVGTNNPNVNFENPPVVETVLSVQFESLEQLRTVHYGLFWQEVRTQFPRTEENPTLGSIVEKFDGSFPTIPHPTIVGIDVMPVNRLRLIDNEGQEMVQIQKDRFIKNWRKIGNNPYSLK